jgi:hypothetical protein
MRAWAVLLAFAVSCRGGATPEPAAPSILLGIEQDGVVKRPEGGKVRLRRAPFTLLLRLEGERDIDVAASMGSESVEAMRDSDDFDDIPGFHYTGMAEGHANPDRELWVSRNRSHSWFAEEGGHHRFDAAPEGGVGRRTVSRVRFLDGAGGAFEVADLPHLSLHLCLARGEFLRTRREPSPHLEVWRHFLRVALEKQAVTIDFGGP